MCPANNQPYRPGSGEEVVRMALTIYGHGGHLEFRIVTFLA